MNSQDLKEDAKEAVTIAILATGIGYVTKKIMKRSMMADPSTSLQNFGEWCLILIGAIYSKNYLIDQKVIPK